MGSFDELCASETITPTPRLRRRLAEEGYIWLRGGMDVSLLTDAQEAAIAICKRRGLTTCSTRVSPGLAILSRQQRKALVEDCRLDWFATDAYRRAATHEGLVRLLSSVQRTAFVRHPRRVARHGRLALPHALLPAIAAHQDQHYVGVPASTLSVWMCTAACPRQLGALALIPGSHRFGILPHEGPRERVVLPQGIGRWATAQYELGDVLVLHSRVVHMPLPNRSAETLRISIDVRFAPRREFHRDLLAHPQFGSFG